MTAYRPFTTRSMFLLAAIVISQSQAARANLTFDLRADSVSGTDVQLNGSKSVTISSSSAGGGIVFELWAIITGSNADPSDERINNFAVRAISSNSGAGAVRGNMANTPPPTMGIQNGYDQPGFSNGTLMDLDGDGDMDIGGVGPTAIGYIVGRNTTPPTYVGGGPAAEFLLYRFSLPIDQVTAVSSADLTVVNIERHPSPTAFLWSQDGTPIGPTTSNIIIAPGVTISIPEPSTVALALLALAGVAIALRRRRRP
jgi:hypothetical protein